RSSRAPGWFTRSPECDRSRSSTEPAKRNTGWSVATRGDIGMAPAWAERWRVVAPAGAVRIEVGPRGRIADRGATAPRTPLALCASGPFARRRVRRAADRAGITLEREYLALPSARSPAFLVDDRSVAID